MNGETCNCPCCQEGIEAPHEFHLERRPMVFAAVGLPAPMSEAEVDAELRSLGIDPGLAAQKGAAAVADARARCGGYTCGMCGKDTPHQHTPEEVVIFRNGIKRAPEGIRAFLHALQVRNEKDNGLFPQLAHEVEADAKALRRVVAVLDFYHPPRTSGVTASVQQAEAELKEMRQHGNADDATEAAAHLERVKHDAGVAVGEAPDIHALIDRLDGYLNSPEQIALRDELLAALRASGVMASDEAQQEDAPGREAVLVRYAGGTQFVPAGVVTSDAMPLEVAEQYSFFRQVATDHAYYADRLDKLAAWLEQRLADGVLASDGGQP